MVCGFRGATPCSVRLPAARCSTSELNLALTCCIAKCKLFIFRCYIEGCIMLLLYVRM